MNPQQGVGRDFVPWTRPIAIECDAEPKQDTNFVRINKTPRLAHQPLYFSTQAPRRAFAEAGGAPIASEISRLAARITFTTSGMPIVSSIRFT